MRRRDGHQIISFTFLSVFHVLLENKIAWIITLPSKKMLKVKGITYKTFVVKKWWCLWSHGKRDNRKDHLHLLLQLPMFPSRFFSWKKKLGEYELRLTLSGLEVLCFFVGIGRVLEVCNSREKKNIQWTGHWYQLSNSKALNPKWNSKFHPAKSPKKKKHQVILIWAMKKKLLLSIESWLFTREPYNGLL